MVRPDPGERVRSVQLYGVDPLIAGRAVRILVERDLADHIDLNFGCPAPKVTRRGGGAALPWKRDLLAAILRETPCPIRALAPQASASTYSATRTKLIAMRGGPRRGDAGQLSTPASRRGKSATGAVHHRPGRPQESGSTPMRAPNDIDSPGSRRTAWSRTAADSTKTMEGHSFPSCAL